MKENDKVFWMVENIIILDEVFIYYDLFLLFCFVILFFFNGLEVILCYIRFDERRINCLYILGLFCFLEKVKFFIKREGSFGYYLLKKVIYFLCL